MSSISIIIPLYNKDSFIQEAILSLRDQLEDSDEIVIVDDCSTDNSFTKALTLATKNIHVIRLAENLGPASARNTGVSVSKGAYIMFFDADDVAHPEMLAKLRNAIHTHSSEDVFTFKIAYDAYGEDHRSDANLKKWHSGQITTVHGYDAFVKQALKGRPLCTASSTCVSKVAFNTLGGFKEGLRYCEDPEFWARLSACYRIVGINETLATYRQVPLSLSGGMRTIPGSVQPYVETLLKMSKERGPEYMSLAKSFVIKNIVFSRAAYSDRRAVKAYLQSVAFIFGNIELNMIKVMIMIPSLLLHAVIASRQKSLTAYGLLLKMGSKAIDRVVR